MKRFLIAGMLALCLMASQIAHAADDRDAKIKAEMVENYLLWQEAFKLRDADRIISFESPDYTSITKEGNVKSKKESDEMWHDVMDSIDTVYEARAEIKKLTIESNRVVVLSNQYCDCLAELQDGKLHRISISGSVRDIWVNYDNVWMLKRSEDVSSKVIVDGKPLPVD